jgi:Flp pilus assembly pilin Flp
LRLFLSGFWADRSVATAIEYGLVMAGIALAILAGLNLLDLEYSRCRQLIAEVKRLLFVEREAVPCACR